MNSTDIVLSSLTTAELEVYTRAKAVLKSGKRTFIVSDLAQVDDVELVKAAIESLVSQGLVVEKSSDVYSLARRSVQKEYSTSAVAQKLVERAAQVKAQPKSLGGSYEEMRTQLLEGLSKTLKLESPKKGFGTGTAKARGCYSRMMQLLSTYNATISDFVWYVCQQDWSKVGFPSLGLLGSNAFLDTASWYFTNKDKLQDMQRVLNLYDNTFGVKSSRGLRELQMALSIYTLCQDVGASVTLFFVYVKNKTRRKVPSLSLLASHSFLEEFRFDQSKSFVGAVSNSYLGKILDKLRRLPCMLSLKDLEDCNWQLAEAIFEPLQRILSNNNGSCAQLAELVQRAVYEKHRDSFGKYVIDWEGKFTPLAVYWIGYASQYLDSFSSAEFGDWKEVVKECTSKDVNLQVLR